MRRILVVEDEPEAAAAFRAVCDPHRYVLIIASTLEGARRALERPGRLDLVVVDSALAGGRGTDLCREVKARSPDTPVVILSTSAEHLGAAERAGVDHALLKPFEPEALQMVLGQAFEGSGRVA